jgi:hypothetical protein
MLLQLAIIKHHDSDLFPMFKPPHPVIVYFLHVTKAVSSKIVLHEFQKPYLMCKERIFILLGFTGEIEALPIRYNGIVLPVLIKPRELPPVDIPVLVWFTVEHIGINATDSKTAVIYPAFSIIQEPAGSTAVILCT